jgi:copper chaperone
VDEYPQGVSATERRKAMRTPPLTFVVEGMSCGHCKLAIVDEVSRVSGVDSVDVDLDSKLVRVRGNDVDDAAVIGAIDEAGYDAEAA